jgi:hypothetical protein
MKKHARIASSSMAISLALCARAGTIAREVNGGGVSSGEILM